MASYFRNIPDFDYVSRTSDKNISEYIKVKNLFKRGKIREDILSDLSYFTKYTIIGDDRPDNIAFDVYGDEKLDWIILLANNIQNIQTEWPLTQSAFESFIDRKYGSVENANGIHHYESEEVRDSTGKVVFPKGVEVSADYSIEFLDSGTENYVTIPNIGDAVTNIDYEINLDNTKRFIYLIKQEYVPIVMNDMEEIMPYKQGSTQYVSETLKRGENIRLFE